MPGRISPPRAPASLLALALGSLAALIVGSAAAVRSLPRPVSSASHAARAAVLALPLSFEENRGQAGGDARFLARGPGYALALSPTEAVLSLSRRQGAERSRSAAAGSPQHSRLNTQHSLRLRLLGGNPRAKLAGVEKRKGVVNYLLGNDPNRWRTNVPTFARVKYDGVYPGVDLVYYGNRGQLEYDFNVAPGADPGGIRFSASGAEKVELSTEGDLLLHVGGGVVRQKKPVAYQLIDGQKHEVPAEFLLNARTAVHRNTYGSRGSDESAIRDPRSALVSFKLARYDATRPLVIDPSLIFSSFLGGTGSEAGNAITVDAAGCIYVTGTTTSATDFPTVNPYQNANGGGDHDAFVTKISADGGTLLYSTYLGGSAADASWKIAVDSAGEACIAGGTSSSNYPLANAYQGSYGGGDEDGFVTRLSATGAGLVYSTYLGGAARDFCSSVALGADGAAYVTGPTASAGFPLAHAFRSTIVGSYEGFVTRLTPGGSALDFSTLLGGDGIDQPLDIAVDASGSACVAGITYSTDLALPGAFQTTYAGGGVDGFVSKVTWDGTAPAAAYSSYLGGAAIDVAYGIAVDSAGAAYLSGYTASADFPVTAGAYQTTRVGTVGHNDAFVAKVDASGASLEYCTYLAGSGEDQGYRVAVDNGQAVVVGLTSSDDFPTRSAYQSTRAGGFDGFITRLAANGASLVSSTLLGGADDESVNDVVVVSSDVVVVGQTKSSDFPTSAGARDTILDGTEDAFVARVSTAGAPTDLVATPGAGNFPALSWSDNSANETGFSIERKVPGGSTFTEVATITANTTIVDDTALRGAAYVYRVRAVLPVGYTDYSNEATFTPAAPAAPTNLSAALAADGVTVTLNWTDNANNELGYVLSSSTDGGSTWTLVSTLLPNTTSTTHVTAGVDASIRYRVAAANEGHSSSATVDRAFFPTNLAVTEGASGKPVLTWDDAFSDETGFRIERKLPTEDASAYVTARSVAANVHTSVEDTTATPGVMYAYRVLALTPAGTSLPSAEASYLPNVPATPSGLTARTNSQGTSVTVSWTDEVDEVGYVVVRTPDFGSFDPVATTEADTTSVTDTASGGFYYLVQAYNDAGYSSPAVVAASPEQPSDLTAVERSDTRISLAWTDRSSRESGFEIQAKRGSGSYATIAHLGANTQSYDDTDLLPSTTYTYRVRSVGVDAWGISPSDWAGPASATTVGEVPAAPSNLQVFSPERGSVVLTWMDNSTDESGFKVYRRVGSAGAYSLLTTLPADTNTCTDSSTTGDTKYSYTVSASNDRGVSASTKEQSVTTLWGPESLTASAITTAQINLSWKDMSLFEDGYSIERKKGGGSYYEVARASGKTGKNQTLTYNDTGLTSGISYTYRVRAYNTKATSLYANGTSITTTGAPAPSLEVTPASKSYGRVPKGQARTATFTVKNAGKKPEQVTVAALGGAFEVLGQRHFTLAAGASRAFKVRFTAKKPGLYRADLPVKCGHGEVVKLRLDGRSIRG
jgi:transcriptional regulator CtsR